MRPLYKAVLLGTLLLASCHSHTLSQKDLDNLADTLELSVLGRDTTTIEGLVLGMEASDNYILLPLANSDQAFFVQPLREGEDARYFGYIGRGPGEFVNIDAKSLVHVGGDSFEVFDSGQFKTIDLRGGGSFISSAGNNSSRPDLPHNGIKPFGDGYIDLNILEKNNKEYVLYDSKGAVSSYLSAYPSWEEGSGLDERFLYIKSFTTNPSNNILAAFYGHFYAVRFYKSHSGKPLTVCLDLPYDNLDPMKRKCYTGIPHISGDVIDVLCLSGGVSELHRWNWQGHLTKRYILPVELSRICLSPDGQTLFGYSNKANTFYIGELNASR